MVTQKLSGKGLKKKRAATSAKRPMTFFEILDAFSKNVPAEQLAKHPEDGARYLDHYLYGIPKEDIE